MAVTVSRKIRVAVGAPLAVVVLVAGFLLFHGDFARWSDNSALDEACDGLLDRGAVRDVLGEGEVDVDALGGALAHCRVTVAGGGSAEIEVVDTAAGLRSADGLPLVGGGGLPVPVGQGWTGHFDAEFDPSRPETGNRVTGSVLLVLSCARASGTEGLAVRVHSELDGSLDNPANRPRYARIATSTAAKADEARRCAARLGGPVDALGLPVTEDQYQPLVTADGTCAGVPATRGMTVGTGTTRGGAPIETCRVGTVGTRRVDLAALFGPYAEEELLLRADGNHGEGPTRDRPRPPARGRRTHQLDHRRLP